MKNSLLLSTTILLTSFGYSQTNCESIKKENEGLKSTITTLSADNEFLKKVLDVNKPIVETEKENSSFKIIKVVGNKVQKNIEITFLVESKDEDKKMTIDDISVVDIEGNEFKIDFLKSSRPYPELSLNVPLKLTFSFKDVQSEPLFIKIFKFKTNSHSKKNPFEKTMSNIDFKDIKVLWN